MRRSPLRLLAPLLLALAGYFIIGKDPFTLTALALLRDAARRGVRVKVLVDDRRHAEKSDSCS